MIKRLMEKTLEILSRESIFCMEFYKVTRGHCSQWREEGCSVRTSLATSQQGRRMAAPRGTNLPEQPRFSALPYMLVTSAAARLCCQMFPEVLISFMLLLHNQALEKWINKGEFQPNIWSLLPFLKSQSRVLEYSLRIHMILDPW